MLMTWGHLDDICECWGVVTIYGGGDVMHTDNYNKKSLVPTERPGRARQTRPQATGPSLLRDAIRQVPPSGRM